MKGLGDCQDRGTLLFFVSRSFMIVIVVCWMFVGVLTDVKVEVEEACAELPVAVPIADGVEAETADADGNSQRQDRAG